MRNKDLKYKVYKGVYQNSSLGYVLTPSELAFEMVSTLPNEVFQSDSTKFLDPITKSGTFLFEIVEKLYDQGHSIKNIQSRIYTVDSNTHSLNIANSYIKYILNRESGGFKVDLKSTEKYFNYLINRISNGKYTTFSHFIDIILLDKNDNYLMAEFQKTVNEFIKEYERISKLESKLFGEVFTQRRLIDEMLDTLPKEVWNDHKLKWLDPAVGIGNFPAAIKDRYMESLVNIFPDDKERERYILEEMLYMCDISIKNLFILYNIFDKNNEFKLNVYRGSFLEEGFDKHMKEVWGLDGFDVVVGNPPYQDGGKKEEANKLYPIFIYKGINILNKNGFCLMITPTGWFSNTSDIGKGKTGISILKVFKYNNLVFLEPDSNRLKNDYFNGVGSTFCYFLCKKNQDYIETNIGNKINVDIRKFESLPKIQNELSFSIILKYLDLSKDLKKLIWIDQNHNLLCEESKIKNDYLINKNYHTPANGVTYVYSSNIHKYKEKYKVIVSLSGKYMPFIDRGEIGFSNMCAAVLCDDDIMLEKIYKNLNNKLFRFLIENNKFSGFNPRKFIINLPELLLDNEYDYYNYFNLTQEEIDLIENTIKD